MSATAVCKIISGVPVSFPAISLTVAVYGKDPSAWTVIVPVTDGS